MLLFDVYSRSVDSKGGEQDRSGLDHIQARHKIKQRKKNYLNFREHTTIYHNSEQQMERGKIQWKIKK